MDLLRYQAARTLLRRRLQYLAMGSTTPFVAAADGDAFVLVPTRDFPVGYQAYSGGAFQGDILPRAVAEIASRRPGYSLSNRTVLEVGANIGTHTLQFLRAGAGHVVAVEPSTSNARVLRANAALNGAEGRVTVVQAAAGAESGQVELALDTINSGDHRVQAGGRSLDRATETVALVTLDGLAEDGTIERDQIALAWVDVQGFEGAVLAGATKLLEAGIPIVLEFWPAGLRETGQLDDLLGRLASGATVIDLGIMGDGPIRQIDAAGLKDLVAEIDRVKHPDGGATDLLLLP